MKATFLILEKGPKWASGVFTITNNANENIFEHRAMSGSKFATEKNNGALEEGNYAIDSMISIGKNHDNWQAFTLHDFGWFAGLAPLFPTTRSALGCHPDGSIEGSAGCIVFKFKDLDTSVKLKNLITSGLETQKTIPVLVMSLNAPYAKA